MDERLKFIGDWLRDDEAMAVLCRRYAISRKTGYQLVARYEGAGLEGLAPRSRAPHHQALAVSEAVEGAIVQLRGRHPRWGPRKLRVWLQTHRAGSRWPAPSTIGELLHRHGLSVPRRRHSRSPRSSTPLAGALAPNDVWSADFKGWFLTRDGQRCLPLTVTDNASRFLLRCQMVRTGDAGHVQPLFEAVFREYGLPHALRTDNGPPFASTAVGGLSRLAIWWIKLGIRVERIEPGHPEQNGRHERFHLTLQQDTAQPPQATGRAQQRCFDRFRHEYNEERPHEALGQHTPASVYVPSPRPYPARVPAVEYAAECDVRRVRHNGTIKWRGHHVYLSQCLAGEPVALAETAEACWRVCFGPLTLGWLTTRPTPPGAAARRATTITPKLLPMCPV